MPTDINNRSSKLAEEQAGAEPLLNASSPADEGSRRRLLLKNLGKGAALLAAAKPIQSLAQGSALLTTDGRRCSVSGMQSGVHSRQPDSYDVCGGYSPGWWQQNPNDPAKRWPAGFAEKPYTYAFPTMSLPYYNGHPPTLWEVMSDSGNQGYRNTPEWHWIGAWLNGIERKHNFPYTSFEIRELYENVNTREDAYTLITTYLENHTG